MTTTEHPVVVVVRAEDGTEIYRAEHTVIGTLSFGKIDVTFEPALPLLANGQTLTVTSQDGEPLYEYPAP